MPRIAPKEPPKKSDLDRVRPGTYQVELTIVKEGQATFRERDYAFEAQSKRDAYNQAVDAATAEAQGAENKLALYQHRQPKQVKIVINRFVIVFLGMLICIATYLIAQGGLR